ncbi:MAG: hypothetical protein MK101_03015 [Phycisphaerales bacterium]|nr:hypothetical protein [Phycisphaerales bacterium]
MPRDLADQRVTVMGLGHFGGGEGLVRWLMEQQAKVLVTDLADAQRLEGALERIEAHTGRRPDVAAGGHTEAHFTDTDMVVVNPAVPRPWDNPFVQAAVKSGACVTTAMRLLVERLPDRRRVIGITGTVGKSTTATMLHHMLKASGLDARLGGNIGSSLLPSLHTIRADTWVVLECSSAQLWWLGDESPEAPCWSPGTAVTTNIAPNHLDWHGSEAHYRRSKAVLFQHQQPGDVHIEGPLGLNEHIELRVPGAHNQANAALAIAAASTATSVDRQMLAKHLATFSGLEHRLQAIDDGPNPRFWNDAKSSTPQSTELALAALSDRIDRVHLIVGGYDKGVSLDALARRAPQLAGLYCIGATGETIAAAAGRANHVHVCHTLEVAVKRAIEHMAREDVLLLSPACASWDQYPDYRARGAHFIELVQAQLASAPTRSLTDSTP